MAESLEEQRKLVYKDLLAKPYVGCVFDIDGTLIERGQGVIPAFVSQTLAKMGMTMPMAVCTGRSLKLTYEKIAPIFSHAGDPSYCQMNLLLICENGSIGYYYEPVDKIYKEMYRVEFPYESGRRESIFTEIKNALDGKTSAAYMNEVSMVFSPLSRHSGDAETMAKESAELAQLARLVLDKTDPKHVLRIGDAGIAINIFPYKGNKERGLVELAKFLREKRGINIGDKVEELVCVGDQPGPQGNDELFLDGNFGTPFTVGEVHPTNVLPVPVYDPETGSILKGPEATMSLIGQLQFRNELSLT